MFRGATGRKGSPDASRRLPPAARLAFVGAAEEGQRRASEDPRVGARRALLHVPDVELDPVRPRERCTAVDLRPAGDPRPDVEPVPLPFVVLLDLVPKRRPWPDASHLAADDV